MFAVLLSAWCAAPPAGPAAPGQAASAADIEPHAARGDPAHWIEQLGSSDYHVRERATQALLESGPAAVPFLQAALARADPEVRHRLLTVLGVLAPRSVELVVARLAVQGPDLLDRRAPVEIDEWARLRLVNDQPSSVVCQRVDGGLGEQVTAAMALGDPPWAAWIRFGDTGESDAQPVALIPDDVLLLWSEDRVELESFNGRIVLRRHGAQWVAWLRSTAPARQDPIVNAGVEGARHLEIELTAAVQRQLGRIERPSAVRTALSIAGHWAHPELAQTLAQRVPPPALHVEWWLARLRCHDATVVESLSAWLESAHLVGGEPAAVDTPQAPSGSAPNGRSDGASGPPPDPQGGSAVDRNDLGGAGDGPVAGSTQVAEPSFSLQAALANEVLFELTEARAPGALARLVSALPDLAAWEQHRALGALNALLESEATLPAERARILDAVMQTDVLGQLQWYDPESELLVQLLYEQLPERFAVHLARLLEEGILKGPSALGQRTPTLVRAFHALREQQQHLPTEVWFPHLALPLLEGRYVEEGLCVVRDALLRGALTEEQWASAVEACARIYRSGDGGSQHRLDILLRTLLRCEALSDAQLRDAWRIRIGAFESEQSYVRHNVERELTEQFGALPTPAPTGPDEKEAFAEWAARGAAWRERLLAASTDDLRASFTGEGGAAPETRLLIEADVRLDDDRRTSSVAGLRLKSLRVGHAVPDTGPYGEDRTRMMLAPAATPGTPARVTVARRFELGGGLMLTPDQPLFQQRGRMMFRETILRSDDLGARTSERPARIRFRTLLLLTDSDVAIANWDDLAALIVARALDPTLPVRDQYLDLVGQLWLTQAAPALRERFAERPDAATARTLLELGDESGVPWLRETLAEAPPMEATKLLEALLARGDAWAAQRTMEWLENPPARLRHQAHVLLEKLDQALIRYPDTLGETVARERLLAFLVASLDQAHLVGRSIPILRRLAQQDFGYYEVLTIPDMEARRVAQAEVVERWKAWWRLHSNR